MTRRLYLHIGLPKTGTTYLQGGLWAHKAELRRAGLLLPGAGHRRHLLASLEVREDPGLAKRPGDVRRPWGDLVDELRAFDGDALVTHEFFAAAAPAQVERVLADVPDHEVHVVVTARGAVSLGLSRWQEWVKNGGKGDVDHYPPRDDYDPTDAWGWGSFDLADVLERWGSVVPHERIHVLPMAARTAPPDDLWRRFLTVVGQDPDRLPAPPRAANESLGLVEVELLRRVTPHLPPEFRTAYNRGAWIRGYLGEAGILPRSGERYRPSTERWKVLRAREERGRELVRTGGFDVVGDPAMLESPDVSGLRHPSEATDAELLDAAVRAMSAMTVDVRRLTLERDALASGSGAPDSPARSWRRKIKRLLLRRRNPS